MIQNNELPKIDAKKATALGNDAALTDAGMNTMDALKHCMEDSKLIGDQLKGLLGSANRHGDLQVMRSAALRIAEHAGLLIEAEELTPNVVPLGHSLTGPCRLCAAGNPRVRSAVSSMYVHPETPAGRRVCSNQSEASA